MAGEKCAERRKLPRCRAKRREKEEICPAKIPGKQTCIIMLLEKNQVLFIYDFLKKQSFRIGWNHSEFQSGC